MIRHELIPVCKRIAQKVDKQDNNRRSIAIQQLNNLDALNAVAKDTYAVLNTQTVSTSF